ncbi:hypothetical protein PTSG_04419 [Salpingoeca rosetta]|uniref:Doublecortin domain-containing protein n=1 Tax=Salpingoeca rosetta (strain ATCC 50818 / BSB-021) TaxID=946362 RepID=F2U8I2_SALR5|nr:uncharacterized protein PTSG_04419 [Salpingoeca rosetta]EGD72690.1 hypothetical protein PTSG_04419 [Salpingoeca rosetta]|eukprot:XP_004994513.1 hypothetical protein PTSG_04419 [Salpingoeca rosetta]
MSNPTAAEPFKPRKIRVYRNGDTHFPGRNILIRNPKVDFTVFLDVVTQGVKANFGAVHRLYDAETGHRVRAILDLEDGRAYVAAGKERFRPYAYAQIPDAKTLGKPLRGGAVNPLPPVHHIRKPVRSGRARKAAAATRPIIITVLRNGETGPGVKLMLGKRDRLTFDQVFRQIEERVALPAEPIRKMCDLQGHRVNTLAGIFDGAVLVAVGRRHKFKRALYENMSQDDFAVQHSPSRTHPHHDSSSSNNPPMHSLNNKAVLPPIGHQQLQQQQDGHHNNRYSHHQHQRQHQHEQSFDQQQQQQQHQEQQQQQHHHFFGEDDRAASELEDSGQERQVNADDADDDGDDGDDGDDDQLHHEHEQREEEQEEEEEEEAEEGREQREEEYAAQDEGEDEQQVNGWQHPDRRADDGRRDADQEEDHDTQQHGEAMASEPTVVIGSAAHTMTREAAMGAISSTPPLQEEEQEEEEEEEEEQASEGEQGEEEQEEGGEDEEDDEGEHYDQKEGQGEQQQDYDEDQEQQEGEEQEDEEQEQREEDAEEEEEEEQEQDDDDDDHDGDDDQEADGDHGVQDDGQEDDDAAEAEGDDGDDGDDDEAQS